MADEKKENPHTLARFFTDEELATRNIDMTEATAFRRMGDKARRLADSFARLRKSKKKKA